MNRRHLLVATAVAAIAFALSSNAPPWRSVPLATAAPAQATTAAADPTAPDREEIVKSARDFEAAFANGDAKAIAGLWTRNGELRDADGQTYQGRVAIEQSYTEMFKANAGMKIEVLVKSIRFPAKDMAVEEGLLRLSRGQKALPATTSYVAVHSREDGRWKIALSSEGGVGLNRLEDLDWVLGEWMTKVKEDVVKFSFARDPKKPVITGTFTRTPPDKQPLVGTIRIALDPETGQIRSWGFEDDGAHSQSIWVCDGKSWVLDARGVMANGTPTAERIILFRVDQDTITWRCVDRILGDRPVPDTAPMRLTRVK